MRSLVVALGSLLGTALSGPAGGQGPHPWPAQSPEAQAAALAQAVDRARALGVAAGIIEAPVTAGQTVVLAAIPADRMVRWTSFIDRARQQFGAMLGPGGPGAQEGIVVLLLADGAAQARVVRAGALDRTSGHPFGGIESTHHITDADRTVVLVVDASAEVTRTQEDLLVDVVAAALHQSSSDAPVPPWVVEGCAALLAAKMSIPTPWHEAARRELVEGLRSNPARALGAFASGSGSPPGAGWLAAEMLERERPGAMRRLVAAVKEGASVEEALQRAAGISMDRLAESMVRWHRTND